MVVRLLWDDARLPPWRQEAPVVHDAQDVTERNQALCGKLAELLVAAELHRSHHAIQPPARRRDVWEARLNADRALDDRPSEQRSGSMLRGQTMVHDV